MIKTVRIPKGRRNNIDSYLKEKNIRNPTTAVELAAVLRKFYGEARKKDGQMYSKNSLCSIRFSLFNSLRPSASVDNILLDRQNSSYPTQPHSIIAKYIYV